MCHFCSAWMLKYSVWTRGAQPLKTSKTTFTACLINSIFAVCLHKPSWRAEPRCLYPTTHIPSLPHLSLQGVFAPSTLPPTSKPTGSQTAEGLKPQLKPKAQGETWQRKQEGKQKEKEKSTDRAQKILWLKAVVAGVGNSRQNPAKRVTLPDSSTAKMTYLFPATEEQV